MPSIEALEALLKGPTEWETYRAGAGRTVDLTSCDLKDADLSNRSFENCDLSASHICNCNLDRSIFRGTSLKGSSFKSSSFVSAAFENIDFDRCDLRDITARQARFADCILQDVTLDNAAFLDSELSRCGLSKVLSTGLCFEASVLSDCRINNVELEGIKVIRCKILGTSISNASFRGSDWIETSLSNCDIVDLTITGGTLTSSSFLASRIKRLLLPNTIVENLDLSGSIVENADVGQIGPRSANLLDVALVRCTWPDQVGSTSILGTHRPSKYLIAHPVQDIKSIAPDLRRKIADAQFLMSLLDTRRSGIGRATMRIWGITSDFGRSVSRLTAFSALVIFVHSLALATATAEVVLPVTLESVMSGMSRWIDDLSRVLVSFIGAAEQGAAVSDPTASSILFSARVFGFFVLGVWISIAANRISRLSAE